VSSPFKKPSEYKSGAFFKPADHMNDIAILVEPKVVQYNVENEYNGQKRTRDEVNADLTFFGTSEALDKGEPTLIVKNSTIVHGMLTGTAAKLIDEAMVAQVHKVPTKMGSGYAWRDVAPEIEAKVANYFTTREAKLAEAIADAPSFE
jgi:hypothetical protein